MQLWWGQMEDLWVLCFSFFSKEWDLLWTSASFVIHIKELSNKLLQWDSYWCIFLYIETVVLFKEQLYCYEEPPCSKLWGWYKWLDCKTHAGSLKAERTAAFPWKANPEEKWQHSLSDVETKLKTQAVMQTRKQKNLSLKILRCCRNVCPLHGLLLAGTYRVALKYQAAWRLCLRCMYNAACSLTAVKELTKSYTDYCCCLEGTVETTDQFFLASYWLPVKPSNYVYFDQRSRRGS